MVEVNGAVGLINQGSAIIQANAGLTGKQQPLLMAAKAIDCVINLLPMLRIALLLSLLFASLGTTPSAATKAAPVGDDADTFDDLPF